MKRYLLPNQYLIPMMAPEDPGSGAEPPEKDPEKEDLIVDLPSDDPPELGDAAEVAAKAIRDLKVLELEGLRAALEMFNKSTERVNELIAKMEASLERIYDREQHLLDLIADLENPEPEDPKEEIKTPGEEHEPMASGRPLLKRILA